MQPKTAVGIVLALLARSAHADHRTAILQVLAPALRSEVERTLLHVEGAPEGSAERASRVQDLLRQPAVLLRAWPADPRVGRLLGANVDPLAIKTSATLPLPRRRYRAPKGLREFLIAESEAPPQTEASWHV